MRIRKTAATVASAFVMCASCYPADAKAAIDASAPISWHSDSVVYVAGLADVKPNTVGSLALTMSTIDFAGADSRQKDVHGSIPFDRITAVSTGDERVATGGTSAKVARAIPFFGFGAAMGAMTNKKVDLLTIEYRDTDGGYHGAVFEVPKTQAAVAQQQLASFAATVSAVESQTCRGVAAPDAILVAPISFANVYLPAEYRVLLYEQLVSALETSNGPATIYRTGNGAAPCSAKSLRLSVTAFKKGNEAVRASTGPVGLFVGGTSVTFHVSLTDQSGEVVFEKSLKTNKRGDGDSVGVTRDLARSVSKRLAKAKRSTTRSAS